jgi:A/G-specific adenine glycosylase
MIALSRFQKTIWNYYRSHGRTMPWRETRDPYRILVSEIMLQQTQVARVIGFYETFIKKFPDIAALARARTSDVLTAWQGLGYNRRALALQRLAKEVVKEYQGKLPRETEKLIALPGIGAYTAGALRAFAFDEPDVLIETNIRRVFIHFFFPEKAKQGLLAKRAQVKVTDEAIRRYIERTVDHKRPREWYFALMDYGAMLGEASRKGSGMKNPNRRSAHYLPQSAFKGSDRELRGKILRVLIAKRKVATSALATLLGRPSEKILSALEKEGFLTKTKGYVIIAK